MTDDAPNQEPEGLNFPRAGTQRKHGTGYGLLRAEPHGLERCPQRPTF